MRRTSIIHDLATSIQRFPTGRVAWLQSSDLSERGYSPTDLQEREMNTLTHDGKALRRKTPWGQLCKLLFSETPPVPVAA
jgi:hypothetical protein